MLPALALFVAAATFVPGMETLRRWEAIGPLGGDILGIAVDPATPTTLYAATVGNGIFKSADGGAHWRKASAGLAKSRVRLPSLPDLSRDILIDPAEPRILYAVTGGEVFRSENSGENWHPAGSGLEDSEIRALAMDPRDPATLFAASSRTVFRTSDRGSAWRTLGGVPESQGNLFSLAVDPRSPTTLFGGTAGCIFPFSRCVVVKSNDGGESWTPVLDSRGGWVDQLTFAPTDPGELYAVTRGGIFRTADGGLSWVPLPAPIRPMAIVFDPADPATLYVGGEGLSSSGSGVVLKSLDRGLTWQSVSTGLSRPVVQAMAADPRRGGVFYAGTSGLGVAKTLDGGRSWFPVNEGMTSTRVAALSSGDGDAHDLLAGTNSGVFRRIEGEPGWRASVSALDVLHVTALAGSGQNPAVRYAGTGAAGGIFRSADAGETWQAINRGLTNLFIQAVAVDPAAPGTVFALADLAVFRSSDTGDTWEKVNIDFQVPRRTLLADPSTRPTMLYGGGDFGIFRSADAGVRWTLSDTRSIGTFTNVLALDPLRPGTIYAGMGIGGVLKSTDHGETWVPARAGLLPEDSVSALAVSPREPGVVYCGLSRGTIFESRDGGMSWSVIARDLTSGPVRALSFDRTGTTLYAGTDGGGVFSTLLSRGNAPRTRLPREVPFRGP